MNIFNLTIKEIEQELDKALSKYTPEELFNELVECGLELNKNEEDTPWVIETEEELDNLIQAMSKVDRPHPPQPVEDKALLKK